MDGLECTGPKKMILVAEDDVGVREPLSLYLESFGHTVHQCMDGAEAIRAMGTVQFDIVITDLNMPTTDGLALLRYVSRLPHPIVTYAISGDPHLLEEATKQGATESMLKPFSFSELAQRIDSLPK